MRKEDEHNHQEAGEDARSRQGDRGEQATDHAGAHQAAPLPGHAARPDQHEERTGRAQAPGQTAHPDQAAHGAAHAGHLPDHTAGHAASTKAVDEHAHLSHGQHVGAPSAPMTGRHAGHTVEDFQRRFWIALALTIPILALTPEIQRALGLEALSFPGQDYVAFALASVVYFYGGFPFLQGMVREVRERLPGMMTLIGVAITAAYLYSAATVLGLPGRPFFWELATLISIMLLGHWLEMKSILGASRALEELARLMPSEAHKIEPDGAITDTPLDQLSIGDSVLIKPGEKIPADGMVFEGQTSVNESMLTGESTPVVKTVGSEVIGGSINGEGAVKAEVKRMGKDSFLAQVIDLVRQAQESKSRTQDLSNKVAFWLTIIALSVGALTFVVWLLAVRADTAFSLERAVTVMVIACPHALGLAVPLVVAVSTTIAASNGLLIRDRVAFENARNIQAIIFDKTGTLTQGKFSVTDVVSFDPSLSEQEVLKYAASVEAHSEHPIAKGITERADETLPVKDFKNIPGVGAQGIVDQKVLKIVSPGYAKSERVAFPEAQVEKLAQEGKTTVVLLVDDKAVGAVALADVPRPESREAINQLKNMGIRSIMLTGDNKQVAGLIAKELAIDEFVAEVLPQQKVDVVREIQSRGLIVAMTGDGVNDAPALAQADVGIAIGSGTDVAVETADIILIRSNPQDAVNIIKLARSTYSKMVQNLLWATGYNTVAIPLAAGVLAGYGIILSPALAAIFMSASTIIVAINARFLKM